MMKEMGVYERICSKEKESIELLKKFVEIESFSYHKIGIDHLSNEIEKVFSKYPIDVKRYKEELYGDHIRFQLGKGEKQILFISHLDTVFPQGTITNMPFIVEGDKIKGPGVIDIKASYIMMYHLFDLINSDHLGDYQLVWLLTSDEEIGSPSGRKFVESEAQVSEVVLVLEPAADGALKTSRKGGGKFTIEVFGKSAHAGLNPEDGANAIEELAHQILHASSFSNEKSGTTINIGEIRGGSLFNVVPDYACAVIDVRVLQAAEVDRIEKKFQKLSVQNPKTRLEVSGSIYRPPMIKTEKVEELYQLAKKAAHKIGLHLSEVMVGGGSDGNYAAAVGATVLDGLGCVGGKAHSSDEFLIIDSIAERTALLYEIVKMTIQSDISE